MIYAIFAATAVAWLAAYFFILRPRLQSYRLTAGIYNKLGQAESNIGARAAHSAHHARVAMIGLASSMMPVIGELIQNMNSLNWSAIFPSDRAAAISFCFALAVAFGPILLVCMHSMGVDNAAKIEPAKDGS